jgi:hypothetical protein
VNAPGGEPSPLVDPDVVRGHWKDHQRHDGVVEFPPEVLAHLPLPPEQRQHLQQAGLPRSAAPYLTFDDRPPEVLQDMIWEPGPAPRDPYRRYVVLDVDRPGAVVLLDHDHGFTPALMNSSIPRLVASLLLFEDHVAVHGLDACREVELLGRRLQTIDPDAWAADG